MSQALYADNDLDYRTLLEDIDEGTGATVPVTEGAVRAFIGSSTTASAAANPALVADVTHIGVEDPGADDFPLGTWLIHIDRDVLTLALLDSLFFTPASPPKPYLILDDPAGARVVLALSYKRIRKALVA